jgi:DNA-binding PadR family transcriptional regulator
MPAATTTLGHVLLGLLHQEPRSGYDLRKVVVSTPMSLFSDSPGAIYPALRSLQKAGLIVVEASSRVGRRRSTFVPSAKGRAAFVAWLRQPPTHDDVTRLWPLMMLRLAFMDGLVTPADVAAFLARLHAEMDRHAATLEAFLAQHERLLPPAARLALESGIQDTRGRAAWLTRARRQLSRRRSA